jgi:hypothetical protein
MIMMSSVVETKVERLLAALDGDIRHLETTLAQLDALRGLLIKRDDGALARLLTEIRSRTEAYAENEQTRQMLRADLAMALGCGAGRLTLSKLQSMVPEPQRASVATRQERLSSLIAELKREYMLTVALVSDCARFNRTLMRTFFGVCSQTGVLYSPSGQMRQPTTTTLMSLQL